ncbi:hypothetical protein KKE07_00110, partial [Candidatus Dependentiae bacterium]|nr:hypothetical protein [Candidatus Dependentiae bacterium]
MKKLNNEIWQKWAIIKNKNISYDIKNIIYGKYGLVIELYGVDDFVAQDISIKFGYPIAYRLIDHDYNEVKYQKLIQN